MPDNPLIAVATSGGVNSSTVATTMHCDGKSIVAMTMQLRNRRRLPDRAPHGPTQRCCRRDDGCEERYVVEYLEAKHHLHKLPPAYAG